MTGRADSYFGGWHFHKPVSAEAQLIQVTSKRHIFAHKQNFLSPKFIKRHYKAPCNVVIYHFFIDTGLLDSCAVSQHNLVSSADFNLPLINVVLILSEEYVFNLFL